MGVSTDAGTPVRPSRAARAAAAGAGEHAQTAWDVLAPEWAAQRRSALTSGGIDPTAAEAPWLFAGTGAGYLGMFSERIEEWHTRLAAIAALAPEPEAGYDIAEKPTRVELKPYPWVPTTRLRRQHGPRLVLGDVIRPAALRHVPVLGHLITNQGIARWAVTIAERPDGLRAAFDAADGGWCYYGSEFDVLGCDAALAVAAAVLARRGPDALEVGLRLAASTEWGLASLCEITDELVLSGTAA